MRRLAIPLVLLVLLAGCGEQPTRHFVPAHVPLLGAKDVQLGGTLVGGRLAYGRGRRAGRRAAMIDIARGRPQWIGRGYVSYHHSGVNPGNGLPGVASMVMGAAGGFFDGYNDEIELALRHGRIAPPAQIDETSNVFALTQVLVKGAVWPELADGRTPLGTSGGAIRLDPHPDDATYAYAWLERSGAAGIRFALVTRPVRLFLPENGRELVLEERRTMRVFHRETGALLRQFPHSEQRVDEARRLLEKHEAARTPSK